MWFLARSEFKEEDIREWGIAVDEIDVDNGWMGAWHENGDYDQLSGEDLRQYDIVLWDWSPINPITGEARK